LAKGTVRNLLTQIGRFGVVGVSSSIIEVVLFAIMTGIFASSTLSAQFTSVTVSMLISYSMNHHFTFGSTGGTPVENWRAAIRYLLLNLANIAIVTMLIDTLADDDPIRKILMKIASLILCSVWNFMICRSYIFVRKSAQ